MRYLWAELLFYVFATAAAPILVWPLTKRHWPTAFKALSIVAAVATALLYLLFEPFTGRSIEDVVGHRLKTLICDNVGFDGCSPYLARIREAERQRQLAEEQARASEAEAARLREAERQRELAEEQARAREAEAARLREADRQRELAEEQARASEAEAARLREAERQRELAEEQRRAGDAEVARSREAERQRELAETQARARAAEAARLRIPYAATAVGRVVSTRGLYAFTAKGQGGYSQAEGAALEGCAVRATNCSIGARFSGVGRCVYVAGGTTTYAGGMRNGWKSAATAAEALDKCRAEFRSCEIFHSSCNGF